MTDRAIKPLHIFEEYDVEEEDKSTISLTTKIHESSLNYYGKAHGGFLFAICDQVAGLVGRHLGHDCVTQQSSITYLKAGELGQEICARGSVLHHGRQTIVVDVVLQNQQKELIAKATFTMFIIPS